jgi:hypothetical protein
MATTSTNRRGVAGNFQQAIKMPLGFGGYQERCAKVTRVTLAKPLKDLTACCHFLL